MIVEKSSLDYFLTGTANLPLTRSQNSLLVELTIMLERKDIEFPLWRKKVDATFLRKSETPIPNWLLDVWNIKQVFKHVRSKQHVDAKVDIIFNRKKYNGYVTKIKHTAGYRYRLTYDLDLMLDLREAYLMSYMRALEGELNKAVNKKIDVEKEIPFWEFIDIEFDYKSKIFKFTSHYYQHPQFPQLFKRLVSSAPIKMVHDELARKEKARIHKQGWCPRSEYKNEIGAENVIYTLLDIKKKLIYIGEASKMIYRFDRGHPDIKEWDYYKYNVLPKELEEHRVTIERMAIRDMAALIKNKQNIDSFDISSYKLANRKIDK